MFFYLYKQCIYLLIYIFLFIVMNLGIILNKGDVRVKVLQLLERILIVFIGVFQVEKIELKGKKLKEKNYFYLGQIEMLGKRCLFRKILEIS